MSNLYVKLVGVLIAVGVVASAWIYVGRLHSTIEFQKAALVSAKGIIEEQKTSILAMTEEKKDFETRLEEASKSSAQIKKETTKKLATTPVPTDCKPQVQWLKKRALDLKQDKK